MQAKQHTYGTVSLQPPKTTMPPTFNGRPEGAATSCPREARSSFPNAATSLFRNEIQSSNHIPLSNFMDANGVFKVEFWKQSFEAHVGDQAQKRVDFEVTRPIFPGGA